jgi:hypothetical protein
MNETRPRVLLIIGSAKPVGSASEILGGYLCDQMSHLGWDSETMRVVSRVGDPKRMAGLFDAADRADLIVLSFGLYMDSPPAPVIYLMEQLYRHRRARSMESGALAAIVNCGMPEATAARNALPFVETFSDQASLTYRGGLSLGMSELIDGKDLDDLGAMARHARAGFQQAARDLANQEPIAEEAIERVARPFLPRWLFLWFGMRRWQNHE